MDTGRQAPGLDRLQRPMEDAPDWSMLADHQRTKRHKPQDWNVRRKTQIGPGLQRERGPEPGPVGVGKVSKVA